MWQLEALLTGKVNLEDTEKFNKRSHSIAKTMIPEKYRTPISRFFSIAKELAHENWRKIWVITLWALVNLALFSWKFEQVKKSATFQITGYCVSAAKGSAEILKFNMALILIPVCRRTLTALRSTFLNQIIPFDDNINFHKLIAAIIAIASAVHTIFHLTCNYPILSTFPRDRFMEIAGPAFDFRQPTYGDLMLTNVSITGVLMILIMGFSFTLAIHKLRKNVIKLPWPLNNLAGFNSFWYAHHLLVLAYLLLVLHGYFLIIEQPWFKKTVHKILDLYILFNHPTLTLIHLSFPICRHGCISLSQFYFMQVKGLFRGIRNVIIV